MKITDMSDERWKSYQEGKAREKQAKAKREALRKRLNGLKPAYSWDIFPEEFLWLRPAIEKFTAHTSSGGGEMAAYVTHLTGTQSANLQTLADQLRVNGCWQKLGNWIDEYDVCFYDLTGDVSRFLEMLATYFWQDKNITQAGGEAMTKYACTACRVCGFQYAADYYPWGEDGNTPSYDFCVCCHAEFGFDDWEIEELRAYRAKWLSEGAKFRELTMCPENWNLEEQLKNVPEEFR